MELKQREEKYRTLFEAANDGIFIQDGTGFRDCNNRSAEVEAAKTSSAAMVKTRKGRVLLMDDEDLVRTLAGEMIAALGHDVVSVEDGGKAIELFLQGRNPL